MKIMPKNQEPPRPGSKTVHLVSQAKGGVGKSVIASWIAQYLQSRGQQPRCFDSDPGNQTFSRFQSLNVQPIELIREGDVDPGLYDNMVEQILTTDGPFVIDTGASTFTSLWNYIDKNRLFDILAKNDVQTFIHVPLAAEPDLIDTLDGFRKIALLSPDHSVVLWLNQRNRQIRHGEKGVLELDVVTEQKDKLFGIVLNSSQVYDLNEKSVSHMLRQNATFAETTGLNSMDVERLRQVRDEVYQQLGQAGL